MSGSRFSVSVYAPRISFAQEPDFTSPIMVVMRTAIVLMMTPNESNVSTPCARPSISARTAGFNTTDTGALTEGSKLVTMILMFIGGSPGSTAGGIKTTTVVILIVFVRANLMEAAGCNVFNRRLDETAIRKASVVMCTNLFLILTGTIFMEIMQPFSLSDVMFEVFSAMGTVGMSAGITRDVCMASRMVLVFLMFCGRIGSLTFALSLKGHRHGAPIRKPVEEITIG